MWFHIHLFITYILDHLRLVLFSRRISTLRLVLPVTFLCFLFFFFFMFFFFFQAEDGIRDLVRSRGLGDVYKRQTRNCGRPDSMRANSSSSAGVRVAPASRSRDIHRSASVARTCLLYTSDAADERSSVDLGGRRIIKKKKTNKYIRSISET